MNLAISLRKMSATDKLRTLEEIWSDLQTAPDNVPSPAWHADVLHAREKRARDGKALFNNWSEAKLRIRKRVV